ncbi:MAG: hypothetical protein GTN36_06200 [Candidatus Aenigmarchaeota archaeon]|nr:hypothetical protein [Candidatus Aenigmarchaeota archaeon]
MPVIGINLKSIEAKRHEEVKGPLRVNSNMNITDIKEQDLPALKNEGLLIEFEYRTTYISGKSKNIAEINIDGNIVFLGDEKEIILKSWKKDKALPDDIKLHVIGLALDKCSKKAIFLSDDLQLPPPPLMLPQAAKRK